MQEESGADALKKLRESLRKVETKVNAVDAKVGYLRNSTVELKESVKDMGADLDAFIDVYAANQQRTAGTPGKTRGASRLTNHSFTVTVLKSTFC